jgi:hypothetical protein
MEKLQRSIHLLALIVLGFTATCWIILNLVPSPGYGIARVRVLDATHAATNRTRHLRSEVRRMQMDVSTRIATYSKMHLFHEYHVSSQSFLFSYC